MPWRCAAVGIVEKAGVLAVLAEALVVGEEERLVLHDRPAERRRRTDCGRSGGFSPSAGLKKPVAFSDGVAEELPAGAVEAGSCRSRRPR